MGKYVSLPIEVNAVYFDGVCLGEPDMERFKAELENVDHQGPPTALTTIPESCPKWVPEIQKVRTIFAVRDLAPNTIALFQDALWIGSAEGPLKVVAGSWIILDLRGDMRVCGDDVFSQTYEPVVEKGGKKK